jgi:hypothetical protein
MDYNFQGAGAYADLLEKSWHCLTVILKQQPMDFCFHNHLLGDFGLWRVNI